MKTSYSLAKPRRCHVVLLCIAALLLLARLAFTAPASPDNPVHVYLFASSTCEECREVKTQFLPKLKAHYGERVAFTHIPVDDVESFKLQLLYEKRYGVNDDEALKVFVGEQCLSGKDAILERLDAVIGEELAKCSVTPCAPE